MYYTYQVHIGRVGKIIGKLFWSNSIFFNKQRERGRGVHRDGETEKGQDQRPSRGDEVSKPKMKAEG